MPSSLVLRGILAAQSLDFAELRDAANLNHALYGFYGISVWLAEDAEARTALETTKLVKFRRYAEFTVADMESRRLRLDATGRYPHYDVVYGNDADELAGLLAVAPHQVRINFRVDREEH